MTVPAGVLAEADADGWLKEALALEANERWEPIAAELRAENAQLREENVLLRQELARRDAELEQVNAELAVLQWLVFGRSSEQARPDAAGRDGNGAGERGGQAPGPGGQQAAGLLASAQGRGGLGFSRQRVLLPGVRHAV